MTKFNVRPPKVGKIQGGGAGSVYQNSVNQAFVGIKKVFEEIDAELFKCLDRIGGKILGQAQELAPLDTGALRESGKVEVLEFNTALQLQVGFGGPNRPVSPTRNAPMGWVDYAFEIHEDLERSYQTGGPKFLEIAFHNNIESAKAEIVKCVRDVVAREAGA